MSTTATHLRRLADAVELLESPLAAERLHGAALVLPLVGSVVDLSAELGRLRTVAAVELRRNGWKVAQIAEAAGVTSSAISQLLGHRPPAELEEASR